MEIKEYIPDFFNEIDEVKEIIRIPNNAFAEYMNIISEF